MNDKYDRQTRLWGPDGQLFVKESRLLVLNCDGTACEILKNLILGGIGYFEIIDSNLVDKEDMQENFFTGNKLGVKRGEACLANLLELNPDVKGNWVDKDPKDYNTDENLLNLSTFTIVISSNLKDDLNAYFCDQAEKNNQRYIAVKTYGLIGYIRLYEKYHGNIQRVFADIQAIDLRVGNTWPELEEFCNKYNLDTCDEYEHKHIPFVVFLIQALKKYGKIPSKTSEEKEFKELVKKMERFEKEENMEEARNNAYHAFSDKLNINLINPELATIFSLLEKEPLEKLMKTSNNIMSSFFVINSALKRFYKEFGTLPVVGKLPDMTSFTDTYVCLKKIYEKKASEDKEIIFKFIKEILNNIKDTTLEMKKEYLLNNLTHDFDLPNILCKNWQLESLLEYKTISEENVKPDFTSVQWWDENNLDAFRWYLLIKSFNIFYEKHKRFPEQKSKQVDTQIENFDIPELKNCTIDFLKEKKLEFDCKIEDDHYFEMCRYQNSRFAPIVSIIGSIASQEILKLITYQFSTINNTIIFNGITSKSSNFKF